MTKCKICKKKRVRVLRDFGPQPLCNRFLTTPHSEEYRHPLVFGQCEACGLIQLSKPVPSEEIAPRFEWLTYNEPEEHLDLLADAICDLPNINNSSIACGITYKDDTLLKRLGKRELGRTWRINPKDDFDINIPGAAGETVLPYLESKSVGRLRNKYGRADVVIARHAFEHAPDTHKFLKALKRLVAPGGYIVFEVPDCTLQLCTMDYSMPWEEHILYFTPNTFRGSFYFTDLSMIHYQCYPYPVENALVAITRYSEETFMSPRDTKDAENNSPLPPFRKGGMGGFETGFSGENECIQISEDLLEQELMVGRFYASGLDDYAKRLQQYLKAYRETKGKIAVFGAGHLACMYINLLDIRDYIEFVVDDNPNKKGLFMPGSSLPIYDSSFLLEKRISLCLLSLSPESEARVIEKNQKYIEQGGRFASIFPYGKYKLNLHDRHSEDNNSED